MQESYRVMRGTSGLNRQNENRPGSAMTTRAALFSYFSDLLSLP